LSLYLAKHHATKTYWTLEEVSGQLHATAPLSQGKEPPYPLDGRLGGLQNQSGHGRQKNSMIAPTGNRVPVIQPEA